MLQPQAIVNAKQGQVLRIGVRGGGLGNQQHQLQGVPQLAQGQLRIEAPHPLLRVSEALAQPNPIGLLQAGSPQQGQHRLGTAAARIGKHRQGGGPPLQGGRQGLAISAVQADPTGVLPGATNASEGQLQRGGGWLEPQPLSAKPLQQQPSNAKPERIATGQHHHRQGRPKSRCQFLHQRLRLVAGDQPPRPTGGR